MNKGFWGIAVFWAIIFLFHVDTILSEQLKTETSLYSVTIISAEDIPIHKKSFTLHIVNKRSKNETEISFANTTVDILGLYPLDNACLVVHGKLGSGGDIVTIINMDDGKIVDTIWGWYASISSDWKKIAYNFRYQPSAPPLYRTSTLLLYDLMKSPVENSMTEYQDNPMERGFILWPEENRDQKRYFIPATSYEEQQHISSPIVWNKKSDKVCFLMRRGKQYKTDGRVYLVTVDISDGLLAPHKTIQEVDTTLFYKEKALKTMKEKSIDRTMAAEELSFSDDDLAVEIRAYQTGPFDGKKTVKIKIKK